MDFSHPCAVRLEDDMLEWLALCEPLIKIQNGKVTLIHQSIRDYLLEGATSESIILKEFRIKSEEAHFELAQVCLRSLECSPLQQKTFTGHVCSYSKSHPFLEYAVFCLIDYVRLSSSLAVELIDTSSSFFRRESVLRMQWCRTYSADSWRISLPKSMFLLACTLGVFSWVQTLLDRRRNLIEETGENGKTALQCALDSKDRAIVDLLLDHGANVESCDGQGRTALLYAAAWCDTDIVHLLLVRGSNLQARDSRGDIALHLAATMRIKEL